MNTAQDRARLAAREAVRTTEIGQITEKAPLLAIACRDALGNREAVDWRAAARQLLIEADGVEAKAMIAIGNPGTRARMESMFHTGERFAAVGMAPRHSHADNMETR